MTQDELNAAEDALTRAREDLQRALVAANAERKHIDAACWHRRYDADLAAAARTTPAQRARTR